MTSRVSCKFYEIVFGKPPRNSDNWELTFRDRLKFLLKEVDMLKQNENRLAHERARAHEGMLEHFGPKYMFELWRLSHFRGNIAKTIKGMRGQAFLREMLQALDALPEKKLVRNELVSTQNSVSAIGSVALLRNIDTVEIDTKDLDKIASTFGISPLLAREIIDINDEFNQFTGKYWKDSRNEEEVRYQMVRNWVIKNILAIHYP